MNLVEKNRELLNIIDELSDNLKEIDKLMIAKGKLDSQDVKRWYYQHLVVKTLKAFAVNESVKIPKYVTAFSDVFGNDLIDIVYPSLILLTDSDDILQGAFNDLRYLLSSQLVKVNIEDELSYWELTTK